MTGSILLYDMNRNEAIPEPIKEPEPVVEPVKPVEPVVEPVEPVIEPVETIEPVVEPVEPIVEPEPLITTGEDNWNEQSGGEYEEFTSKGGGIGGIIKSLSPNVVYDSSTIMSESMSMKSDSIGLAVGGANDVENFRENIKNGYLPSVTDLTYEGLFYDYYFKPVSNDCKEIFCPAYDAFIDKSENKYISVGLTSGITKAEFDRDNLDIVIVLDVSGSMSSSFDRYYYDRSEASGENDYLSKIEVAKKALIGLVDNLDERDRLGIILFNNGAHVAKPLEYVADLDREKFASNVKTIIADGGTNMESGYTAGIELFDNEEIGNSQRIIFLTDAIPNIGVSNTHGLAYLAKTAEKDDIHTTMIGIGVDFNSQLVKEITDVRGANYYSVHSADEFIDRMDEEFSYMVTPIVYDLELFTNVDAKIYGAAGAQDGEIFHIKTLFPSASSTEGNKGGIILLEIKSSDLVKITASYTDTDGDRHEVEETVIFGESGDAIRKAVLLKEYVDIMHDWINDIRGDETNLEIWEKPSITLHIDEEHEEIISEFRSYFRAQIEVINDRSLVQEIQLMNLILESADDYYENDDKQDNEKDTWIAP